MSRRQVIAAGAAAAATLALPPLLTAQQRIVLNDASQLNPTPVRGCTVKCVTGYLQ